MIVADAVGLLIALSVLGLAAAEFKKWLDARVRVAGHAYPLSRLLRRTCGGAVLIAALACARLALSETFSVRMQFRFLLMALLLCLVVLLIVVWDFCVLRRQTKRQIDYVAAKSVQELRSFVEREKGVKGKKGVKGDT